jgi:hypothetical protein
MSKPRGQRPKIKELKPLTDGASWRPPSPEKADDAWTVWHLVHEYGYRVKDSCAAVLPKEAPYNDVLALKARFEELNRARRTGDVVRWSPGKLAAPLRRLRAKKIRPKLSKGS